MLRYLFIFLVAIQSFALAEPPLNTYAVMGPDPALPVSMAPFTFQVHRVESTGGGSRAFREAFQFTFDDHIHNVTIYEVSSGEFLVAFKNSRNRLQWLRADRKKTIASGYICAGTSGDGRWYSPNELLVLDAALGQLVLFDATTRREKPITPQHFLPNGASEFHFGRPTVDTLLIWAPNPSQSDFYHIQADGNGTATVLNRLDFSQYLVGNGRVLFRNGAELRSFTHWFVAEGKIPPLSTSTAPYSTVSPIEVVGQNHQMLNGTFYQGQKVKILGWDKTTRGLYLQNESQFIHLDPSSGTAISVGNQVFDPAAIVQNITYQSVLAVQVPREEAHWVASHNINVTTPSTVAAVPSVAAPTPLIVYANPMKLDPGEPIVQELLNLFRLIGLDEVPTRMNNRQVVQIDDKKGLDHIAIPPRPILAKYGLKYISQKLQMDGLKEFDPLVWGKEFGICKDVAGVLGDGSGI